MKQLNCYFQNEFKLINLIKYIMNIIIIRYIYKIIRGFKEKFTEQKWKSRYVENHKSTNQQSIKKFIYLFIFISYIDTNKWSLKVSNPYQRLLVFGKPQILGRLGNLKALSATDVKFRNCKFLVGQTLKKLVVETF